MLKKSHFYVFLVTVCNFPKWKHKSLCGIVHGGRKAAVRTSVSEKEIQVLYYGVTQSATECAQSDVTYMYM